MRKKHIKMIGCTGRDSANEVRGTKNLRFFSVFKSPNENNYEHSKKNMHRPGFEPGPTALF